MKVVKLDKRNRAFKYGFTHAIRFGAGESSVNFSKLKAYLEERYPRPTYRYYTWSRLTPHLYAGSWETVESKGHYSKRIYWICVKNEAVLTMALLAVDMD